MIVPMKRVTILCAQPDREAALQALRELGVLHVTHVRGPEGGELEQARQRLSHLRRNLELIAPAHGVPGSGCDPEQVIECVWSAAQDRKELDEERETLERERTRLLPLGSFNPALIAELEQAGVWIRLHQVPAGAKWATPEGAVAWPLHEAREGAIYVVVSRKPVRLDFPEFRLPDHALDAIERRLREVTEKRAEAQQRLDRHAGDHAVLAGLVTEAEERVAFLEARDGMGLEGPVAYIQGYAPAEAIPAVRTAADRRCWVVLESEPAPGEAVPTFIRNPRWVKPIKAIFDFIGVTPGYEEIDISAVFLLFLSLFFAMLVGDAGYGLLFLALTAWGRKKLPRAPAYPFNLMYIMSVATVAWGAVTGAWFGAGRLPTFLEQMTVAWLREPKNVMFLCFVIGAAHLTIAHLWNILRGWNSPKALAQLGWIGSTWTMFLMARNLVLDQPLPGWWGWLLGGSVLLIILFMTAPRDFKSEWFNHVMLPLNLVSNFVDLVSYIRLFAVGTAGYAVASSFNTMILGGGVDGFFAGLLAALLLFIGHTLNILLCVMGVLVHGVRLNTLEFSSHIGMAWTGQPYRPFRRTGAGAQD